ncbi:MAG: DUF4965 domain-containing protein [Chthonomonadales bacterium]|nr:DUF4965 domain-containing protein [Chthonomonadales bacterium]
MQHSVSVPAALEAEQPALPVFRAPAVPLVAHDPYFSVWSMADRLTDDWPRHWTGAPRALCGMARIDGHAFRFCGPAPAEVEAMPQTLLQITPTRTTYAWEAAGVRLGLTFLSPLLPQDLDVLSRPVTYLTWGVRSVDGRPHHVELYLDASAEWAVNTPDQPVVWGRHVLPGLDVLWCECEEQPTLRKQGDNLRIDWGRFYVAAVREKGLRQAIAGHGVARGAFAKDGALPEADDARLPRPANDDWPVLATALDLGAVGPEPVSRRVLLAYDDLYSIELMGRHLRPYWRRNGMAARDLLARAAADHDDVAARCTELDHEMTADLCRAGGTGFAHLAILSYRQCLAASKLAADASGAPLLFAKENFSNGCIATVDVIYPACPLFLLLSTQLLRAQLTPLLDYAASAAWPFPFAPHDLGTYPKANGQVYGGGSRTEDDQMPVEESGNMLIMLAAMARADGTADYALRYWPTLERWAAYLLEKGMDPENQLCTDDFSGHLAHNANLSIKAIVALAAFAQMSDLAGHAAEAARYRAAARGMAAEWVRRADDGDHYRLAFDKPGTWSQKYNLVWDRLLCLDLFPPEVARAEMRAYRARLGPYGLPLDSRGEYTKLDWQVWSATLTGDREDQDAILGPIARFVAETPDRVPLTDWYWTQDARKAGFQARSVVGGVFLPLLADRDAWRRWLARGQ